MIRHLARGALQLVIVSIGVTMIAFALIQLSGDPAQMLLPPEASAQAIAQYRHALALDQPLYVQYVRFLGGLVNPTLGQSFVYKRSAMLVVLEHFGATLELSVAAMLFAAILGVGFGIVTAVYRGSIVDNVASLGAMLGQSMPTYWLGIMLIILFAVKLGWLPVAGKGGWPSFVLPTVTLGSYLVPTVFRLARSNLLDVLGQPLVRTARAKGLPERRVILHHGLRNAAVPIVTVLGLQFANVLGGAIVTETVFAWPGVGQLILQAVNSLDYPLVQASLLLIALAVSLFSIAIDLVYVFLDPRVRFG